jgi:hypothetical protein
MSAEEKSMNCRRYLFDVSSVMMRLTGNFRKYAAEQGTAEDEALKRGMEEKSAFRDGAKATRR